MSAEKHIQKGKDNFTKRKMKKAMKEFQKATKIEPDNYEAWHGLGESMFEQAMMGLGDFISDLGARMGLTDLGIKEKEIPKVREYLEKAVELNPEFATGWASIGKCCNRLEHKPSESLQYFKKALELDAEDSVTWNGLGLAHLDLGNNENALECFQQANQIDPENHIYMIHMGMTNEKLGHYDQAIEIYNKILAVNPDETDALYPAAHIYQNQYNDYQKALESWKHIKKKAPWMEDEAKMKIKELKKLIKAEKHGDYGGMA